MEIKDLIPKKDPKAGSPAGSSPVAQNHHHAPFHFKEAVNGTHFSGILLRYIVSFLFGVVSAAYFFGGKSRDISDLLTWRGNVTSTLERMDRDGTNASKLKVDEEQRQIQYNTNSINDLYKRIEPIGAMQAKIERLQHDIDNVKK